MPDHPADNSQTVSWTHQQNRVTRVGDPEPRQCTKLMEQFSALQQSPRISWTTHVKFVRCLGAGGQGIVYLAERPGADGFTLPVAMKLFSPERYRTLEDYDEAMQRASKVAARVARIQHENLLVVQNMIDRNRIRVMVMEFVEGFDLRRLLGSNTLQRTWKRMNQAQQQYLDRVLFTQGETQPRFKAGVAMSIVRDCLAALAALHRDGIMHADIKPANIMLRRSGHAKIIDVGSAFLAEDPPGKLNGSPEYAAVEVLMGEDSSPLSDLASLGYVLVEMLAGRRVFASGLNLAGLVNAKRELPERLDDLLPEEVLRNELLMQFIHCMIAPNPVNRFPSAEAADLVEHGAAAFHRQLIKSDLASEYDNDIRILVQEILDQDPQLS